MTTIIAYILIAYGISATIVLAFALDSIGYWKHEATEGEKHVRYLEKQLGRTYKALRRGRLKLDAHNVIIDGQAKQISGHLKDTSLLLSEVEWWRNGGSAETELAPGELVDELDAWLAGEEVTG